MQMITNCLRLQSAFHSLKPGTRRSFVLIKQHGLNVTLNQRNNNIGKRFMTKKVNLPYDRMQRGI